MSARGIEIHNGAIVIPSNDIPAGMIGDVAEALRIGLTVPATAVIAVVTGFHIVNQVDVQPSCYYAIRYSEHGPDTITIRSMLMFYIPRADVLYFAELITNDKSGWKYAGDVTGTSARGWLRVLIGSGASAEEKYIQLYNGPPA